MENLNVSKELFELTNKSFVIEEFEKFILNLLVVVFEFYKE